MRTSWLALAHVSPHSMKVVMAFALVLTACGDDDGVTPRDSGTARVDGGSRDAGSMSGDAARADSGGGGDAGGRDAGEATSEPMGIDCTDTCPSYMGRDYVCTFLPGFSTTLGYCSLECTTGDPTACVDTEPGEVYCNATVGRCIIGCPFAGCPHGMECSFEFKDQPACMPVP